MYPMVLKIGQVAKQKLYSLNESIEKNNIGELYMSNYRELKNGEKAVELEKSVQLIIKTKCPTKWIIEDLETGQRYRANGTTEIGTMFDPIDY